MAAPELIQYITSEVNRGVSRDAIEQSLLQAGWSQEQINEAFQAAEAETTPAPQPGEALQQEQKKGMSGWVKALIFLGILAVLAPIAIISITVLMSLNTARDQGNDAAVMSEMSQLRSEAELYAVENDESYLEVCESDAFQNILSSVNEQTTVRCFDSENSWAASAELSNTFFCADSTGNSQKVDEPLATGATKCAEEDSSITTEDSASAPTVQEDSTDSPQPSSDKIPENTSERAAKILEDLAKERTRGLYAQAQSDMSQLRAEAELYHYNNSTFEDVCNESFFREIQSNLDKNEEALSSTCNDSADSWAMSTAMNDGTYYCVDEEGFKNDVLTDIGDSTVCPASTE